MKKLALTILVVAVGFVGFAQNSVEIPQKLKDAISVPNDQVEFRMTSEMSNDDIRLEFINNYFKLELADLVIKNTENEMQHIEVVEDTNDDSNVSDRIFTSDLAIRTTIDMRPSLNSMEEITA